MASGFRRDGGQVETETAVRERMSATARPFGYWICCARLCRLLAQGKTSAASVAAETAGLRSSGLPKGTSSVPSLEGAEP